MESPDLWLDQRRAQEVGRRLKQLKGPLETVQRLEREVADLLVLDELADSEGDEPSADEVRREFQRAEADVSRLELRELLRGKYDGLDAIVTLHAGAGGTEAQDWVQMLYRMYQRWAESRGFGVELLDILPGEEAGVKSVAFEVRGDYAYGYLRAEKGVHRLVRISPFDASGRRHTSFASADVLPALDDDDQSIQINPEDLKVDTYRSSGAGGQHVNKTESAVRITHLPTGIAVQCQTEKSQHQNRAICWEMLRSKLYELELEKRQAEADARIGEKTDIGWGHQIRSYVLQPYQLVKDLRTGVEIREPDRVLDGDIDSFMAAALAQAIGGNKPEAVSDIE